MFSFITKIFNFVTVGQGPSFVSAIIYLKFVGSLIGNWLGMLANWALSQIWNICRFVLGIMEGFEYMINSFLGMDSSVSDYVSVARNGGFLDTFVLTFRAIIGVSIVLMIVFTIFAIIKQEINTAQQGFDGGKANNNKAGIFKNLALKIITMLLLPLMMGFIVTGTNSLVTAFNRAIKGDQNVTVAGQVLSSSTYDANKFRKYANSNKRLPIVISAYDTSEYAPDENTILANKIASYEVQTILKTTAGNLNAGNGISFKDALIYKNNKLANSSNFGDYYENFICTPEQYQVMADFIDYVEKSGENFYIKAIDDPDIEWKYVDSSIYDKTNNALTIRYRDASDLDSDGSIKDTYSITYSMSYDVTSPISDALKSIMAMLGVGEYSDYSYKVMERDENYVNLVQWANEKVQIKLSATFDINDPETWTPVDEIIIYEYYHFSSNNTFSSYSLGQLQDEGALLDAKQIVYRQYYPEADAYSDEKTIDCVLINGTYYRVELSDSQMDKYGNKYYVLSTDGTKFLQSSIIEIEEADKGTVLETSQNFDLNDTSSWTYTDQIIVYEYYKDLSYTNILSKYQFSRFEYNSMAYVVLPTYHITVNGSTNTYVLINGTYYSVSRGNPSDFYALETVTNGTFLVPTGTTLNSYYDYTFNLEPGVENTYGISGTVGPTSFYSTTITDYELLEPSDDESGEGDTISGYEKYSSVSFNLSRKFDYKNIETWSYRDYFYFYLYITYPNMVKSLSELQYMGLTGDLCTGKLPGETEDSYLYRVSIGGGNYIYLDIEKVNMISELNMYSYLNVDETLNNTYYDTTDQNLFVSFDSSTDVLVTSETNYETFNFSDFFNETAIDSWTVEDLILMMLSTDSVINSVEEIKESGYSALVYSTTRNGNDKLYRFGKNYNENEADRTVYLSENAVKYKFGYNTVSGWLRTNAMDFIARLMNTTSSQLTTSFEGIINSIYASNRDVIYTLSNLINTIVEDEMYEDNGVVDVFNKVIKYTYTNQNLDTKTPSTWNVLDVLIYNLTGKSVATYESYVIEYDGDKYFIVGDYAVNISDESVFKSTIAETFSLSSASLGLSGSKKTFDLLEYYETKGISSKVIDSSLITTELIRLFDSTYVYHPTTVIAAHEVVDNEEIDDVSGITYLDIIILNILGELKDEDYEYQIYTDGINNYILIDDKCVSISIMGENSDILCKTTGTLSLENTESVFEYTGSKYTAFRNIENEDETTRYSIHTYLDSIIFNVTKSTTKKDYEIYKYEDAASGQTYQFIPVANSRGVITYIEYKEEHAVEKMASEINNDYNTDAQIKALYNNHYKQYYSNVLDRILTGEEATSAIIDFNGFQLANILTWTPIRVILYANNIMTAYATDNKINAQVVKATSGSSVKTYLHFTEYNSTTGTSTDHYIDMTTLATINADTVQTEESSENIYKMYLQLMLLKKDGSDNVSTPSSSVLALSTFNSYIRNTICKESFEASHVSEVTSLRTQYVTNFEEDTPGTWTWFDLVYYYLTGNKRSVEKTLIYTNSNGDKYAQISYQSNGAQVLYLKLSEAYVTTPFGTSIEEVTFDAEESLEPLGIVVYKLTGLDGTNEIDKITISGTGETFYNIKHATQDTYYGIMGINNSSSSTNSISTDVYKYETTYETDDSILDFGVIDLFYAFANATLVPADFETHIYTFDDVKYIMIGDTYINIDILKLTYVNVDTANKKLTNNKTLANIIGFGDGFGTNYSNAFIVFDVSTIPSDLVTASTAGETEVELGFSKTFNPTDVSSWTVSDFFIYYFYQYSGDDGACYEETNFQTFINNGFMIAKDYIMIQSDDFGNSKSIRVLQFGDGEGSYVYVNYEVFMMLYNRKLANPAKEVYSAEDAQIKLELLSSSSSEPHSESHLELLIVSDVVASDFEYLNYYFFKFGTSHIVSGNTGLEDKINDGEAIEGKTINLRLSPSFDINTPSSWTILDYIIIYESTRKVNHNFFEGMSFSELKDNDNYYFLYTLEGSEMQVLEINGNTYDFSAPGMLVLQSGSEEEGNDVYTVNIVDPNLAIEGSVNSYNFKIIAESYRYSVNDAYDKTFVVEDSKNSISYYITDESDSTKRIQCIRTLDVHAAEELYQIDMTNPEWSDPIVSSIVREVNWPQKLMTDMQVIYPDLNWEVLVATDGWLDTLGDFSSANTTGEYISSGNSANITAVGLVLSEFFISVAKESEKGYAEYEYESVFDEQTIKALMLAMLGEYEYEQLTFQAKIFMDLFNSTFAPILEDIANERGVEIIDGKVDNFVMSVYKSYLSTVILSSDFGEYLYKVATRVYAQYSIYEFLANASGDYAGYFAYINGQLDENGEKIDAFTYSSFYELVKYENNISKTKTPTFTFNYANVYRSLVNSNATDEEIKISLNRFDGREVTRAIIERVLTVKTDWDTEAILEVLDIETINDVISAEILGKFAELIPGVSVSDLYIEIPSYQEVLSLLNAHYEEIYMNRNETIPDNDLHYCFMLEAYWSMRYEYKLTGSSFKLFPAYLQLYYKYIMGEIDRWSIMDEVSIDDTSKYMQYYDLYSAQLLLGKAQLLTAMIPLFSVQDVDIKIETDEGIDSLRELISSVDLSVATPYSILHDVFKSSNTYTELLKTALSNSVKVTYWAVESQDGDNNAWLNLLKVAEAVEKILTEFGEVKAMSPGEMNANGSEKVSKYSDEVYENTYKLLSDYNQKFQNYVNAQKMVDKVTKASITYTLAQFGHNYVSAGYNFVLENRNYTLQSTVSSLRLAEYVYGGDFLVQFGVNPTFTSSTFKGIAEHVMVFDPKDNAVKAKLALWDPLREFAKEIADYTAELYFTTNMIDLSENKSDAILMTDYINVKSSISGDYQENTLEYAILEYLIYSEDIDISASTFISLIFGDTVQSLTNLKESGAIINQDVMDLARYLEDDFSDVTLENGDVHTNIFVELSTNETALEEKKISTLLEYIRFVNSYAYTSAGYYNIDRNNPNDRTHLMFVNLMKYLMINEGEEGKQGSKISFENLTFKKFKQLVIEFLIEYKQNPAETPTENASRYLALFNLVNSQFMYSLGDSDAAPDSEYGRTVSQLYAKKNADTEVVKFNDGSGDKFIFADFSIDAATKNAILGLAGVANRPLEDLVNLEYDELYDMQGNYDEAKGDTFIACFYDAILGKYIPYMATNATGYNGNGNYAKYMSDYGYRIYTDYYDDNRYLCEAYPIIVKGIITAAGLPTAVKIEDYEVKFYRTDITATMTLNDGALEQTKVVHESNTVGFNNYVDTTYSGAGAANNTAMFIGSADMTYFLESDFTAQFIQINKEYNLNKDEYGGISVLDDFSAFYQMDTQSYFLLVLAFVVMVPMLFKATASVLRRVLDLLFLILAGPLSISMSALNLEEGGGKKNQMFDQWKNFMTTGVLSVFGYVVGFNIYYVLITTITGMTFVSDATVLKVQAIGGLSFVTGSLLNSVIRYMFILAAGGAIKTSSRMLGSIISAGKVQNAFASALGGSDDVMGSITKLGGDIKQTLGKVKDIYSGKALLQAKDYAIESAKQMIPGSTIIGGAVNGLRTFNNYRKSKNMSKLAQANGVPKEYADKAAKQFRDNANKQRELMQERRRDSAREFQTFMGVDKEGLMEERSSKNRRKERETKQKKREASKKKAYDRAYKKAEKKNKKKSKKGK